MISVKNVTLSFGKRVLFDEVNLNFTKGNCYGVIGANGAGKSTFLKILSGEIEPNKGTVEITPGERMSVLKQNHYEFDEVTVLNAVLMGNKKLWEIAHERDTIYAKEDFTEEDGMRAGELEAEYGEMGGYTSESDAGVLLGDLGVKEETHNILMKDLSGALKVRVLLAQALFGNPDILLLDEPTNHLDINSVEMLIDALGKYEGSLVLVSHDRYFVSKTANKIWEIVDGEIKEFKGTYTEWEEWKKRQALAAAPAKSEKKNAPVAQPVQAPINPAPQKSSIDKDLKRELQKQQKQVQQLEQQIATLKDRLKHLEADMANPDVYGDKQKFRNTENAYKKANADLAKANEEYEEVFEKVMELEEKMNG